MKFEITDQTLPLQHIRALTDPKYYMNGPSNFRSSSDIMKVLAGTHMLPFRARFFSYFTKNYETLNSQNKNIIIYLFILLRDLMAVWIFLGTAPNL